MGIQDGNAQCGIRHSTCCHSFPSHDTLAPKVMNSIHAALAILVTTITCFAQGQVNFANRVGASGSIANFVTRRGANISGHVQYRPSESYELMIHILTLISGGQTGADRAAYDFAIAHGLPRGGWCPKGRLLEDGTLPLWNTK